MSSTRVITYLSTLFYIFGLLYVYSNRGSSFILRKLKQYLNNQGVVTSRTTRHHPTGNAQCEEINRTVWRKVKIMLHNLRKFTRSFLGKLCSPILYMLFDSCYVRQQTLKLSPQKQVAALSS